MKYGNVVFPGDYMKTITISALVWVCFFGVVYGVGSLIFSHDDIDVYALDGQQTIGKVNRKDPDNHQHIYFTYQVGNKQYEGVGTAGFGNPAFENIKIGDNVTLYYLKNKPEKHLLGLPDDGKSDRIGILFVSFFGSIFLTYKFFKK